MHRRQHPKRPKDKRRLAPGFLALLLLILPFSSWGANARNICSVTAPGNSSGLTCTLTTIGNTSYSAHVNAGAAATVLLKTAISTDCSTATYSTLSTLLSAASGDATWEGGGSWNCLQMTSATAGVALKFELSASGP